MDLSERELKLTAVAYCRLGASEQLRATGRLPDRLGGPWASIALRVIIEARGIDPVLPVDEQAVYEALVREQRLPGGAVRLTKDHRGQ